MSDLTPVEDVTPEFSLPDEVDSETDIFQNPGSNQVMPAIEENITDGTDMRQIGDPDEAGQYWRYQEGPNDCALYAQGGVLDAAGVPFDIDTYREQGSEAGWYTYESGTTIENMGELLEMNGVDITRYDNATIQDMANALNEGKGVVVAVDCDPIWGEPGGHALWVTGMDVGETGEPATIFCNDSGTPDGRGIGYPYENFKAAWDYFGNTMVTTRDAILSPTNQDVLL